MYHLIGTYRRVHTVRDFVLHRTVAVKVFSVFRSAQSDLSVTNHKPMIVPNSIGY